MAYDIGARLSFRSFFMAVLSAGVIMGIATFAASRLFIEGSDATHQAELAGYTKVTLKSQHYTLPQRFGCKSVDAIAFVVTGNRASDTKRHDVTVCCGAWFSGCAVRKDTKK